MDIRNWPIDRILQLPDYCLSRRYSVFCCLDIADDVTAWDISELALPNKAIIHEVTIQGVASFGEYGDMRVAIGDQLPTSTAMMDALEPLLAGLGVQGPDPRRLPIAGDAGINLTRLKMFLPAQARRLVLELTTGPGIIMKVLVGVVVSSVPTEVPDWLGSA